MQDSSEDLPKPPRRTSARPFFSPRPGSAEGVTGPLDLSRRRSAQLFTPPGSTPATPKPTPQTASDAADGSSDADFEGDWTPAPLPTPESALNADSADDDQLVVEQFEPKEIELTAAAPDVTDEHSIEVIAYDDANSLLKSATSAGKNPEVDGLTLEATEFSFEQELPSPRTSVESFWASEQSSRAEKPESAPPTRADETEATIDEETAGEPVPAADSSAAAHTMHEDSLEWTDDPSTTISHAQAALEPEPEHHQAQGRESAPMLADVSPPWASRATPLSSEALEELKESEPWDFTPSHGLDVIPEGPQTAYASSRNEVADALARIAARVRSGELEVPAAAEMNDEATLSAVLTALLRKRR